MTTWRPVAPRVKPRIALYVGGMGARGRNFYNDIARRYGYEEAARRIQDAYLAGRKDEATAAVPDALVDEVALCGPRERLRERLRRVEDLGRHDADGVRRYHRGTHHGRARSLGFKETAMRLKDRVAIVTGAASGIGAASALAMAAEGARVLVVDLNESGAKATVERIEKAGRPGGGRARRRDPRGR